MFNYGEELMLPRGTPALTLDGKKTKIRFDQAGRVISTGAEDMAVVRAQSGLFVVAIEDLWPPTAGDYEDDPPPAAPRRARKPLPVEPPAASSWFIEAVPAPEPEAPKSWRDRAVWWILRGCALWTLGTALYLSLR